MQNHHDQHAVINFWQDNAFKVVLNKTKLRQVSSFELMDIKDVPFDAKQPNVWVAPVYAYHQGEKCYWCPVWVPLFDNALPWMGPAYCDMRTHLFDEWLRFEWLDEQNNKVLTSWQEVIDSIYALLNQFNENWQSFLEEQGFVVGKQVIKFQVRDQTHQINPLCQSYAQVEDQDVHEALSFNQCLSQAALLSAPPSHAFNKNAFISAVHALLLQEGELLAVTCPVGAQKAEFIEAIAASKCNNANLNNQPTPVISLFSNSQFYRYVNTQKLAPQNLNSYNAALDLAIEYSQTMEEEDLQETIEDLKAQDEDDEKALAQLLASQDEFERKKASGLLSRLLGPNKQVKQTLQEFSDKIRSLKVARTKAHQQLAELVERHAQACGAKNRWQAWVKEHLPNLMDAPFEEQFLNAKAQCSPEPGQWQKVDDLIESDLLIIDDAHRLLPQEVLGLLTKVKTALFLGDNQEITALPLMSPFHEEWELQRYGLADEQDIEQLQYKGMLPSNGNAFTIALANSSYQAHLEHGVQQATLSLQEDIVLDIQFHAIENSGKSTFIHNQWVNEEQAQFIAKWLVSGPLASKHKDTAIITPFAAQIELIQHALQIHDLHCEVFCVNELPEHKQWENMVFSVVYCAKDARPFVFDVGDNIFYSLQKRATKNIWMIGDLAIFDTRMHSPSGKVAKKLYSHATLLVD